MAGRFSASRRSLNPRHDAADGEGSGFVEAAAVVREVAVGVHEVDPDVWIGPARECHRGDHRLTGEDVGVVSENGK